MIHTIENDLLKVSVNTEGAELWSVQSKRTQTEYLWQGDPAFWHGRAYVLFPFIGRMFEGKFRYHGQKYDTRCHGLARFFAFTVESQTADKIVLLLKNKEEMQKEYPFRFAFRVTYSLQGAALKAEFSATNLGEETMICAFGGHPAINIPFDGGEFEDYYLEFAQATDAKQWILSDPRKLISGETKAYALKDGTKLPLRHDLFDQDAIVLDNTCHEVAIKTDKSDRYVSLRYDDFRYIGFWHADHKPAPYVCLEPWSALPGTDNEMTELETKEDMTHIPPHQTKEVSFTLEIHE